MTSYTSMLSRRLTALVVGAMLATAAAGVFAQQALAADTLQVAVNSPSPEQGIPLELVFSGATEAVDSQGHGPLLDVVVRPAGGIGCQANYGNDHSAAGGVTTDLFSPRRSAEPRQGPGSYREAATYSPPETGTYLVCAWLESENNSGRTTVAGPVSTTFSARGPQVYQLAVGLPAPALPGVAFQIDYTTHTDQQLALGSAIRPAGGLPCAANHELDSQQNQSETNLVGSPYSTSSEKVFGGPATVNATATEPAGPYLICTWIEGPNTAEVDSTASTSIYVGTPPPPPPPPPSHPISPLLALRGINVSKRHGALVRGTAAATLSGRLRVSVSCGRSSVSGDARVTHGRFRLRLATPRRCHTRGRARVTAKWTGSHAFLEQSVSDVVKVSR